jgi:hypothetical protein
LVFLIHRCYRVLFQHDLSQRERGEQTKYRGEAARVIACNVAARGVFSPRFSRRYRMGATNRACHAMRVSRNDGSRNERAVGFALAKTAE